MGRLKLAVVSSHPIQYQIPLFRELARRRIDLSVLFLSDFGTKPSFDRGFGKIIHYDVPLLEGYPFEFLPSATLKPNIGATGLVSPELALRVARGRYDAVVLHGYNLATNLLAIAAPRARGTRLLLRGDSNARAVVPPLRARFKRAVLRALFSRIDHFLTSGALNRAYYERYGVPPDRMTLAPFSVDNDYFAERAIAARPDRARARAELGFPDDRPLFLYAAKLLRHKRPLDLLEAFAAVRREHTAGLLYVGDGELRPAIEREIKRRGLAADVKLAGFRNQSELPAIYASCDALVLPSEDEPWGLVVNEAMASGLAIAVSDRVGCAPDLVRENGSVFPVGDTAAIARVLLAWARDRARLERQRQASLSLIQTWGVRETADGFLAGAERALARG
jgi:glycosyltransferase involved in cell wall biosynthesis